MWWCLPTMPFGIAGGDRAALHEAQEHGRSVGVPEHQLDWEEVDPWPAD